MTVATSVFRSPPRIVSAVNGLDQLGTVMAGLGSKAVMIVCDPGIVTLGFAERAVTALTAAGCQAAVYSDVSADPPTTVVEAAVAAARTFGADGVVGLGGGSSLDTAKLVALMVPNSQPMAEMYGHDLAVGRRLPLVQVPTTAGTGSEVTWVSVVTDEEQKKKAIYAPQLLPDVALLDPTLTLGLPPKVTAATGLDAMVHAIEAYTSRTRKNPIADGLATSALRLLAANIRVVVEDGSNLAARAAMLQGSLMAGMAFVNASVAAIHALAYPLGARFHIPHGHSNALVMAQVIRFNLPAALPLYAELAGCLLPGKTFATPEQAAEAFVAEIEGLVPATGLETRLSALGVDAEAIPSMAEEVVVGIRRLIDCNPRDMTQSEVEAIYRSIY